MCLINFGDIEVPLFLGSRNFYCHFLLPSSSLKGCNKYISCFSLSCLFVNK
jgi:hypothetical protein